MQRVNPTHLSIGDEAVAELAPGLLQLLGATDPHGVRIDEGLCSEWETPVGIAGTALYAVLKPPDGSAASWTGVHNTVEWRRPARPGEVLVAVARIKSFGRTTATVAYRVESKETAEEIAAGELVMAYVPDGKPSSVEPLLQPRPDPPSPLPQASVSSPPAVPVRSFRGRIARALLPDPWFQAVRHRYWVYRDRARSLTVLPPSVTAAAPQLDGKGQASENVRPIATRWLAAPSAMVMEESAHFEIEVSNASSVPCDEVRVEAELPYGYGLGLAWTTDQVLSLPPNTSRRLSGVIRAQRPHEVNLSRPWPLRLILRHGAEIVAELTTTIAVTDPRPGKVYYVLTEDCETFDGGEQTGDYGANKILGNHNNWMDPEEYRIQMIEKPDALNRIAERYGAHWTHFWTATQRFAAAWAAARSPAETWTALLTALDRSILLGSRRHEYAAHIHFDFEPDSALPPQPRLLYDPQTDGILPHEYYHPTTNRWHMYHGWDGSRKGIAYVKQTGDLEDLDSKIGSLRKCVRYLSRLALGGKYPLAFRTGAGDFGAASEDVSASIRALHANGIWVDADAGIYLDGGQLPSKQIYFCRPDNVDLEIDDLRLAGVVQLRVPEVTYDGNDLASLNAWFDRQLAASQGPGVHVIVGLTHAMFMRGEPDPFRSTTGGDFAKLEQHIRYVRTNYPAVEFATASEAALEYLDYYSPQVSAVTTGEAEVSAEGTLVRLPIRLLGRGIPISPQDPLAVTVQVPHFLDPEHIKRMTVLEKGAGVTTSSAPFDGEGLPAVEFLVRDRFGHELEVEMDPAWWRELTAEWERLGSPRSAEMLSVTPGYDVIFRLRRPYCMAEIGDRASPAAGDTWIWKFPGDVFRMVIYPAGGGTEPIGREFHPYGRVSEGAVVYAALQLFGARYQPARLQLKYQNPLRGQDDFILRCRVGFVDETTLETENSFFEGLNEVARATLTCVTRTSEGEKPA